MLVQHNMTVFRLSTDDEDFDQKVVWLRKYCDSFPLSTNEEEKVIEWLFILSIDFEKEFYHTFDRPDLILECEGAKRGEQAKTIALFKGLIEMAIAINVNYTKVCTHEE